jgi:hypothetical protein
VLLFESTQAVTNIIVFILVFWQAILPHHASLPDISTVGLNELLGMQGVLYPLFTSGTTLQAF